MVRVAHTKTLSEQDRLAKNERIKQTALATRARRKRMVVRTRVVKLTHNHLSATQKEQLTRLFLEAKWLRNSALGQSRFDRDYLKEIGTHVPVRLPDGSYDSREFKVLGGQVKQGVIDQLKQDRNTLAALKKKGRKVGRLRFTSEVMSLTLVQAGSTYRVDTSRGRVRVANITGWMRAGGLDQLNDVDELGGAKLLNRPDGFFLAITTYTKRAPNLGRETQDFQPGTEVGIDLGVSTHITLSDGTKIDAMFEETDRLKRLRRKLARQQKGSANWQKTRLLISKESGRINRRKDDCANKISHQLLKNERVYIQDDYLPSWKHRDGFIRGGRRIQASILGRVKTHLVNHGRVVVIPRGVATTATCVCGTKNTHHVEKRVYHCPACGHTQDRDIHAARNMIRLGKAENSLRVERTETPAEIGIRPAAVMDYTSITTTGSLSMKQEAATSSASP